MAAGDLFSLCTEYLEACAAAIIDTPGGPIARAYVSPGVPPFDCVPQLTVHAGGPMIGDTMPLQPPLQPGHRVQQTGTLNLVSMTATVIRCVPTMDEEAGTVYWPEPGALEAAAAETTADVWAIWSYLKTRKRAETLFAPKTREFFLDPAVAVPLGGGAGGWQIQIRVQLDGYDFDGEGS